MSGRARESTLDLDKHMQRRVRVKFQGGREVVGTLKGFDPLVNLVLDDCVEFLRDPSDPYKLTDKTRPLGLVVCRGPTVMLVAPMEGYAETDNPFVQAEEEGGE